MRFAGAEEVKQGWRCLPRPAMATAPLLVNTGNGSDHPTRDLPRADIMYDCSKTATPVKKHECYSHCYDALVKILAICAF
jgi:hypothetical protein